MRKCRLTPGVRRGWRCYPSSNTAPPVCSTGRLGSRGTIVIARSRIAAEALSASQRDRIVYAARRSLIGMTGLASDRTPPRCPIGCLKTVVMLWCKPSRAIGRRDRVSRVLVERARSPGTSVRTERPHTRYFTDRGRLHLVACSRNSSRPTTRPFVRGSACRGGRGCVRCGLRLSVR